MRAIPNFRLIAGLSLFLFLQAFQHAAAQSSGTSIKEKKERLQDQYRKLQEEIRSIEKIISNTSRQKEESLHQLQSLNAKIKSREKLMNNISDQITDLETEIGEAQSGIVDLSGKISEMKADYARWLRKSYHNLQLRNELSFLLSSESFTEGVQRYNYLLKIASYRRAQARELQAAVSSLQQEKVELEATREQKLLLLDEQNAQKKKLEGEKEIKDKLLSKLSDQEKKFKKRAEEKNRAARDLNQRIQKIIEEEIRLARKKAEAPGSTARKTDPARDAMPMTPEEQLISSNFSANRAKLPWPVSRGHIISYFGRQEHPSLRGVFIENNGLDIKTNTGADARSIFGGTVVNVFSLPTVQNCVIIRHGEFFTVYSNIQQVFVKPNQTVSAKEAIGKLFTDEDELTKVHIEIWRGKEKLDPSLWLAPN